MLVLAGAGAGWYWCCCWPGRCLGWWCPDWPLWLAVVRCTGFKRQIPALKPPQALLGHYRPSGCLLVLLAGLLDSARYFANPISSNRPDLLAPGSPPPRLNKGSIYRGVTVRSGSRIAGMSRRSRLESIKGPLPHYVAQYEVGKVVARGAGGLLSAFRDGLHNPSQTQTQSSGKYPTQTQSSGRYTTRPPGQVRGGAGSPGRGVGKGSGGWLGQLLGSGGGRGVESDGVRGLGPGGTRDLGLGSGRQPKALPRSRR